MTFEDWTDVMYETMDVYPWSWIFYLTFIFLTTFAFLNMVIGIVVSVLEEEQSKLDTEDPNRTSLANLKDELTEIKTSLRAIERRLDGDENSPG
jgi:voltage-gated sodium channel